MYYLMNLNSMFKPIALYILVFFSASLKAQPFVQQYLSPYSHGTGWALYYTDIADRRATL
jgi:hypothetical protein